jgi:hypothetical protein
VSHSPQEEGGYEEYASYHPHAENGKEEVHVESAVLVQPLGGEGASEGEAGEGEDGATFGSAVPLCNVASERPCAQSAGFRFRKTPFYPLPHYRRPVQPLCSTAAYAADHDLEQKPQPPLEERHVPNSVERGWVNFAEEVYYSDG